MQFAITVAVNLPPIRGNMGNLQQVFTNLLLNAIQASPGSTIRMRVDYAEKAGLHQLRHPGFGQRNSRGNTT